MSARDTKSRGRSGAAARATVAPRGGDPRVVRTRAAVVEAATRLFLEHGYDGTTMEDVAAAAGLARRTVYNNYADKQALFTEIVTSVIEYAEAFARELPAVFTSDVTAATLPDLLHALGRRIALAAVREDVIALRRLLISTSRTFPELAREYHARAPGGVIAALAHGFERLTRARLLHATDAARAAEQFGYLVAGAAIDRAMLAGELPSEEELAAGAWEAVETFLARYAVGRR